MADNKEGSIAEELIISNQQVVNPALYSWAKNKFWVDRAFTISA